MAATPAEPVDVESQVKRLPWEPRHEWESRLNFVEDNFDTYGLEKTIQLSLVWSNMKFLGCGYPPRVEQKVAHYPLPDLSTLRARRKQREGSQPSQKGKGAGKGDVDRVGRKDDETDSGEAELPHELFSESAIAAKLDSLIAAVRKQTESDTSTSTLPSSSPIPSVLQDIAETVCLCETCLGQMESVPMQKLNVVLQRYKSHRKDLRYDFVYSSPPDAAWSLVINDAQVGKKVSGKKKAVAKCEIAEEIMAILKKFQETHGLPPCPKAAGRERGGGGVRKQPWSHQQEHRNSKRPALGGGNRPIAPN